MADVETETLLELDPELITFDSKNPRGETPAQIENDKSFKELRKSVKQHGVVVPIIARKTKGSTNAYTLVDGERRLRAALIESVDRVPTHVIEGDESDGRILAYNIHMLRKQWNKRIEVNSIKEIRAELIRKNRYITEAELFRRLRKVTTHSESELKELLIILKFDAVTIKKLQEGTLLMSHLIQIDSSFLSPFKREFPRLYKKYGDRKLRKILVRKAENGLIGNTRYLMEYVLEHFRSPEKTKLRNVIKMFLDEPARHVSIIIDRMESKPKTKKATTKKKKRKKKTSVKNKDEFEYNSLEITKRHLNKINDIRPKLEEIASNFSTEESEYIKEAVCCLEKHCFKAAALMIWASGVSRILKYVERKIADYNKSSKEMADNPKSFYRFISKNFQKNATDINDIRENSNDGQLLCYVCHKNFISVPEFKKLKNNFDTRNDCAHPTSISLTPNEIVVIFENVYNLLLNNSKLK